MRALLVDDNPMILKVLKGSFDFDGRHLDFALSMSEASAYLAQHTYNCAIIDFYLPDADGMDVRRVIREGKRIPTCPSW